MASYIASDWSADVAAALLVRRRRIQQLLSALLRVSRSSRTHRQQHRRRHLHGRRVVVRASEPGSLGRIKATKITRRDGSVLIRSSLRSAAQAYSPFIGSKLRTCIL